MFRRYHYLNHNIHKAARCYLLFVDNVIVGFTSILHHPGKVKNFKRLHRTVVLPDYQGIGIGALLRDVVCDYYLKRGFRPITVISNPALVNYMKNSPKWIAKSKTRRMRRTKQSPDFNSMLNSLSDNRYTTSWEYIGNK